METTGDWRGIHPDWCLSGWIVAWRLSPSDNGYIRRRKRCWTRSGAERLVERLNAQAAAQDSYDAAAMLPPGNLRYELVGNIRDHPNGRRAARLAGVLVCAIAASSCNGIQPNPTSPSPTPRAPVTATANQIVVSPGELPIGGGTATILISTVAGTIVAPTVTVNLRVDGGELTASSVTTDNTGHARVTWTGTTKATVTADAGPLTNSAAIKVAEPFVLPPNPPPPPRPTPPAPDPLPTPPPQPAPLELTVSPSPQRVEKGTPTTLTATASQLQAGEVVLVYQWDWDGGDVFVADETSAGASRAHSYATDGVKTPRVVARTSFGRSASATTSVFVVTP